MNNNNDKAPFDNERQADALANAPANTSVDTPIDVPINTPINASINTTDTNDLSSAVNNKASNQTDDLETAAEVAPTLGNPRNNFPPQTEGTVTYREVEKDDRRMDNLYNEPAIGKTALAGDDDRDQVIKSVYEDDEPRSMQHDSIARSIDEEEVNRGTSTLGWTSLVLSIVSLFIFPVVLSSAGIVTGFLAYRQGDRTLGTWSMIVGGVALLMALFYNPFVIR